MITHPSYMVEPWCLRETELSMDVLSQSESVFALSNGHVGWRGNLDEGEPHGLPGSYLNGVFEFRPLPYAEAGYGYPESGQTIINVTNGKLVRLLVDDEPFDLRYGKCHKHERLLDFRTGLLHRTAEWTSPSGRSVRVRSTRLVSFTQRAVGAVSYEIEPLDDEMRIVVQSELVANEQLPNAEGDPRAAAVLETPLVSEEHAAHESRIRLLHRTARSGLRVGVAAAHFVNGAKAETASESSDDLGRFTVTSRLRPGQKLCVEKIVAHGWSAVRSAPAVRDQVDAALAAATSTGWAGLVDEQRAYLAEFWAGSDVEVDGDAEIQQAVRFALFHVLQAGARGEARALPAKGLTGPGYDGHCFWDTETFVLPALTYTAPQAVEQALRWRYNTMPEAQERARQLGLAGSAFPWRTINGSECSGYWPAGTAAFHINADIADAVVRYIRATCDDAFEREVGLPLLVETARLWRSLGHHDHHGDFHIDGVTGPDEYSAIADDNVYTNLMAQHNLREAAAAAERHPDLASALGVDDEETAAWRDAASRMTLPYNAELEVHEQSEGFTRHQLWDFARTHAERYPLLLNFPYFDLYRKQVVKQADLVLAMCLRGDAFTPEEKARNFAYYEQLTVRDSSLSACGQAVMAAEVGHMRLAYDYVGEAAMMDLSDLEGNTRDGIHIASLAGTWFALVIGFGGMREDDGLIAFNPRLPEQLGRLAFTVQFRQRRVRVEITGTTATYTLLDGDSLDIRHCGERMALVSASPESRQIPPIPTGPAPEQPAGRAPARRGRATGRPEGEGAH
ncbi:glycoside hydrolase family 65 protein [Streptomyces hesseae]|uniref:Glycosyl hydrolase family 65 protein n=1 Tax=Streptomyces hesseae TaxID=3075519 RepID=A0ABU2SJA5_9ACTN|nr:glycosyl hydrolase family 65 protein [Streptomyces sp. DSM 40473]MDT0448474.1 glycosyl hydrolase family 65 protein [Streptomyces sp. DSM 40473]